MFLYYRRLQSTIILLSTFVAFSAQAASSDKQSYGVLVVDEITSIYDGDTFRANIKGVHSLMGNRIGIRVSGVDTPEMRGKCPYEKQLARKAKQFTVAFLRSAQRIELRNVRRGKYFRILADVYADGRSLTAGLVGAKLAYQYEGGKKQTWCK